MPPQSASSVSRRRFLRSAAGATLALPWLESIPMRAAETGKKLASQVPTQPPVRFACLCFADGVEPKHWWAKGEGAEMQLGEALRPMEPYRKDMIYLGGLFNERALEHTSVHLGRFPNLLSGAWVSTAQQDIRVGQTMDQRLAQHLAGNVPIPSLVLGIEPTELRLEDGLTMLYGSCISWKSDTRPATKEIYPARVFDLLVGDRSGRRLDRSILDEVAADARSVRREIHSADRSKLDDYLESIRDIEKRIELAGRERRIEGWQPSLREVAMQRPDEALPQDVPTHMRLMMDLIVLAFQMDKTRVATCLLNNDLSAMTFEFLEGVRGGLHVDLTHNGNKPEVEIMHMKTNQFHVQQLAYLCSRLEAIDEGGTTLLDNSLLLCCSNMFDGDQ
ncbi:MAG: DUF1552 domain-containing protein, partial [Verrucomicrobia bacterium]|nr:DUF1552 domain-containing protein [Verrucomicrobiota bacterium]